MTIFGKHLWSSNRKIDFKDSLVEDYWKPIPSRKLNKNKVILVVDLTSVQTVELV